MAQTVDTTETDRDTDIKSDRAVLFDAVTVTATNGLPALSPDRPAPGTGELIYTKQMG